ncbi:hypothetical protein J7384_10835 [Endozoicomonas sp. G2_1]|uniref:hypothetical protein n=1 Tax=Endozoicomonas sp. G2_1 TaxID=2821091 RepID=UPI001ADA26CC|nr:hypothetical protein [Endozoicomonas sp. G2_1]MBO9490852.1 hypothetical protein [Endozoicomonas sp. G2_1]
MRKVVLSVVVLSIVGCVSTPKEENTNTQYTGLTKAQFSDNKEHSEYCFRHANAVRLTYGDVKTGFIKNMIDPGRFLTWETVKEVEVLANNDENIDLVEGYYYGRCMRSKSDVKTPRFEEIKPVLSQCLSNDVVPCASVHTMSFSS